MWRTEMRARLKALNPAERVMRSRRLVRRLVALPAWRAATNVLLYAPLSVEPDLDLLWHEGALTGKRVSYPRVEGTALRLYHVRALDELEPSRWNLREPPVHIDRETMLCDVELVLVPGLAFDTMGGRLGRGGGYYDRLLAPRNPAKTRLVAIGFTFQMVSKPLPLAAYDVKVDETCTD